MTSFIRTGTGPGQVKNHEKRVEVLERQRGGAVGDHYLADHLDSSLLAQAQAAGAIIVWDPGLQAWVLGSGGGGGGEYAIAALLPVVGGYPPVSTNLVPCGMAAFSGPFAIPSSGHGITYQGAVPRWAEIEAAFVFANSLADTEIMEVYTDPSTLAYEFDTRPVPSSAIRDTPTLRVSGRFKLEPNMTVVVQVYHDDSGPQSILDLGNNEDQAQQGHFLSVRLL